MKVCNKCNETKTLEDFYPKWNYCKVCASDQRKVYHQSQKHDPEYRLKKCKYDRDARDKVIEHYGGTCQCCGEARYEFLSIDHIDGGGIQHRKVIGSKVARWLVREGFPEGYRILCHNCNQALGLYGYCPHTIPPKDHP